LSRRSAEFTAWVGAKIENIEIDMQNRSPDKETHPRVANAGFGSGQWQARDQQSSRIIAVRILRSVAGVVHLSDWGLNSRLPRLIGKVSFIHPTINTALSCHLVFHNSLEKSKRAVDSVNLTKK